MNITSVLLSDWDLIIICSKGHKKYANTVGGLATNSADWLLGCMISYESL